MKMHFMRKKEVSAADESTTVQETRNETESKIDESTTVKETLNENKTETQYPPFKIVLPTVLSLYLAVFLVTIDRTIIGVAIPAISNEFQSFEDISWYESSFLLALSLCQLPFGKVYKFFPSKWVLAVIVVVFEAGSVLCAAAPNSKALIAGRAITGVGAAGVGTGIYVIIADLVPLQKRPQYLGAVGALFGISSIAGPLVGGAFTTDITWRWCFWINVPIGGVALAGILFIMPTSPPSTRITGTAAEKFKKFDPLGNLLLVPGIVCLLLAIQWGGARYPWNDKHVIALLVVGSVLIVGFGLVQCWVQENGTIPPRILRQRSIAAGLVITLGLGAPLIIGAFYFPIWFQAIKGTTASQAGIRLLAFFLSNVFAVIACGVAISKVGYYTPFLIFGCVILVIGTALLTTLRVDSNAAHWIGFELLLGIGCGFTLQQPNLAAQTVLSKEDLSTGVAILTFATTFSGSIFLSIAQAVLSNTLRSELAKNLPGFDPSAISSTGATDLKNLVSKDQLPIVLRAYNKGLNNVFYCALATACLALVASPFLEWRSVRKSKEASDTAEE